MERILKIQNVEKEVTYEQWEAVIKKNFPELLTPAKIGLAMIAQILVKDIRNAGAVILLGPASSGKTITTNIFNGIQGFTYSSDNFTSKAFVSGAANVSKKNLEEVDMLPRIRHKLFLVKDMSSLFSTSDEQLQDLLGKLTRVLDGEGYSFDSGVHGHRGYEGDYLFFLLGATTPIQNRVWKVMGNLGPRILFYRMKTLPKSKGELVDQLTSQSYKSKEAECNLITKQFLESLWFKYQEGIDWNREKDGYAIKERVVLAASLLSRLRGSVTHYKENEKDVEVSTENPDRLSQWFYNLARGVAVIQGRTQLVENDLSIILELAMDSGTTLRAKLVRNLIKSGGCLGTNQIMAVLEKSQTTALKLMSEFEMLGIALIKSTMVDSAGRPEKVLCFKKEWEWFTTEECKKLLIPNTGLNLSGLLVDKQTKSEGVPEDEIFKE